MENNKVENSSFFYIYYPPDINDDPLIITQGELNEFVRHKFIKTKNLRNILMKNTRLESPRKYTKISI